MNEISSFDIRNARKTPASPTKQSTNSDDFKPFHSSLKVWPSFSNPASFIPILIEYYPFSGGDESIDKFDELYPVRCACCGALLDSHCINEGDKFRCAWCQRYIKINDGEVHAYKQKAKTNFIYRKKLEGFKFKYLFVLNTCCNSKYFYQLIEYMLLSIQEMPKNREFFIALLSNNSVSYVITENHSVIVFEFDYDLNVTGVFDFSKNGNRSEDYEIISKYLLQIRPSNGNSNIQFLINQLQENGKKESHNFTRIILFSHVGPQKKLDKNMVISFAFLNSLIILSKLKL